MPLRPADHLDMPGLFEHGVDTDLVVAPPLRITHDGGRHVRRAGGVPVGRLLGDHLSVAGSTAVTRTWRCLEGALEVGEVRCRLTGGDGLDRKSTRLNSSHVAISYAVFCL